MNIDNEKLRAIESVMGQIFIKNGHTFLGNRTRVKVIKNKVAPPFKQAEFDIMYNEGISREGNLVDVGVNEGIVEISGAWFSYNDIRLG